MKFLFLSLLALSISRNFAYAERVLQGNTSYEFCDFLLGDWHATSDSPAFVRIEKRQFTNLFLQRGRVWRRNVQPIWIRRISEHVTTVAAREQRQRRRCCYVFELQPKFVVVTYFCKRKRCRKCSLLDLKESPSKDVFSMKRYAMYRKRNVVPEYFYVGCSSRDGIFFNVTWAASDEMNSLQCSKFCYLHGATCFRLQRDVCECLPVCSGSVLAHGMLSTWDLNLSDEMESCGERCVYSDSWCGNSKKVAVYRITNAATDCQSLGARYVPASQIEIILESAYVSVAGCTLFCSQFVHRYAQVAKNACFCSDWPGLALSILTPSVLPFYDSITRLLDTFECIRLPEWSVGRWFAQNESVSIGEAHIVWRNALFSLDGRFLCTPYLAIANSTMCRSCFQLRLIRNRLLLLAETCRFHTQNIFSRIAVLPVSFAALKPCRASTRTVTRRRRFLAYFNEAQPDRCAAFCRWFGLAFVVECETCVCLAEAKCSDGGEYEIVNSKNDWQFRGCFIFHRPKLRSGVFHPPELSTCATNFAFERNGKLTPKQKFVCIDEVGTPRRSWCHVYSVRLYQRRTGIRPSISATLKQCASARLHSIDTNETKSVSSPTPHTNAKFSSRRHRGYVSLNLSMDDLFPPFLFQLPASTRGTTSPTSIRLQSDILPTRPTPTFEQKGHAFDSTLRRVRSTNISLSDPDIGNQQEKLTFHIDRNVRELNESNDYEGYDDDDLEEERAGNETQNSTKKFVLDLNSLDFFTTNTDETFFLGTKIGGMNASLGEFFGNSTDDENSTVADDEESDGAFDLSSFSAGETDPEDQYPQIVGLNVAAVATHATTSSLRTLQMAVVLARLLAIFTIGT